MCVCVTLCASVTTVMDLTGRRGIAGALVNGRGGRGGGRDTKEEKRDGGAVVVEQPGGGGRQWQMQKLHNGENGTGACGRYSYQLTPVNAS